MRNHSRHFSRLLLLLGGGLFALMLGRALILPASFGEFGHYRGDALREEQQIPIVFAERGACAECHADVAKTHSEAAHRTVQCQNCHAPLTKHVITDAEGGMTFEPMPIHRSPELCLRCHQAMPARPSTQPQIHPREHFGVAEAGKPMGACVDCHASHSPKLGGTS